MIRPDQNKEATLLITPNHKMVYANMLSPLSFNAQRCQSLIKSDQYLAKCEKENEK